MATIRKHRGKWQVQVRRKNCRPVVKSFIQRKDAEAWSRQTELEIDRKALPEDPRQLERITLGELVIRYRDTITPRKRSAKSETLVLNAFLRHPICSRTLSELGQGDFARYRDERLQEVKPRSLQRMLCPIQNLYEVAKEEWGLPIRENPIRKLKIVSESNRRERRLKDGELEKLVEAAAKTKNCLVLPIILFALETGLRRSEILAATWGHLDAQNRVLSIPRAKNGHPRSIPLTLGAIDHLWQLEGRQVKAHKGRIFPTTANALRLAWERLVKRAGIEDLHFHDLRHEAISRFFEIGLTMPEVALLSGHRDMRMLFRYSHPQNRRVLEQLDRAHSQERRGER
ncbi:site-specific integrase [Aestuariivirga sp.]|uniref:site-specific integrase n=1 Tax=Aestuariivirga sp. TaxID=2650926 RepID=UPI003593AC57